MADPIGKAGQRAFAANIAFLVALVQLPIYTFLPAQMPLIALMGGLGLADAIKGVGVSTISLSEKAVPRPTTVRTGSDLGNLARGGALNLAGAIVSAAGSAGLMVVLGRGFGATAAGEFLQAVAIFNILIVIGLLGADTGLVRTMSRLRGTGNEQRIGAVLLVGLIPVAVVSGLVALTLWASADGIANLVSTGPSNHTNRCIDTRSSRRWCPWPPSTSA